MIVVERLKESNIVLAAQSLSNAFLNDPLQKYVFPDLIERQLRSPSHFEAVLRYGHMFGEVFSTHKVEAAAVWLTPNNTNITPEKAEQGGLGTLPALLGEEATNRFFGVMDFLEPFHLQDVPEPHWYTMVIGVDPQSCGKGYGSALMNAVMEKAEREKKPIYLETAEPSNIGFYQSLGFDIVRELIEPVSTLPLWTFKRVFQ